MRATLPLLIDSDFPTLKRTQLDILQVNLGYYCNLSCLHCHVNASPRRTEMMSEQDAQAVIEFMQASTLKTLDLTGGAPELHAQFKPLVEAGVAQGLRVIDRCNLTVLEEPGQAGLAEYLAAHKVDVVASLPCYLEENVEAQRGNGVFKASIAGLKRLNALGYGQPGTGLNLDLVFNPQGPVLPPPQQALEDSYREHLAKHYGVCFNSLLALTNLPINRFGSTLLSKGQFEDYMSLLKTAYQASNLSNVMCRNTLSVDYRGFVYDCDFNQMLKLNLSNTRHQTHISEINAEQLKGRAIAVADHCYGCTAGQGSSCGGALND